MSSSTATAAAAARSSSNPPNTCYPHEESTHPALHPPIQRPARQRRAPRPPPHRGQPHTDNGQPAALQRSRHTRPAAQATALGSTLPAADGHRGPRRAHRLRRLQPHHTVGTLPTGRSRLRQLPLLHQCRHRRTPLYPDTLLSDGRGGAGLLLPRHHRLPAAEHHRHPPPAAASDARRHAHCGMASRRAPTHRPPAAGGLRPPRHLPRLHSLRHRPPLLHKGEPAREPPLRRRQPQADAGSGVHRHTLHPQRQ